jgi:hypothetical protein
VCSICQRKSDLSVITAGTTRPAFCYACFAKVVDELPRARLATLMACRGGCGRRPDVIVRKEARLMAFCRPCCKRVEDVLSKA